MPKRIITKPVSSMEVDGGPIGKKRMNGRGAIREGIMGIWSRSRMCAYKNTLKHVVLYSAHMLMKTQNTA